MRASRPLPGDPWPSEMVITVEDNPAALLELLWIREAWGFTPAGDGPPPLERSPERVGSAEPGADEQRAWPQLWQDCVEHLAVETGPLLRQLSSTADGSPERARLLDLARGPGWRERFGDDSLGAPFRAWHDELRSARMDARDVPLDAAPERRCLGSLVPAWEVGLTTVVTLPCRGEYTRAVSGSVLLLTDSDHRDPDRYAAALRRFADGSLE
ncbi:hypothetical protein [Rathayibacter sp. AY2B9]|uniref:hypothetical protein n=1 Tax=Rathayibacter sp. AY2B9 TaxID=2080572 RepID=UPI000CE74A74|nr:hypothetical protein [Rathayibacter sp. AY2B9]PPG28210.1 hypothetical protein C5C25_13030 [Rathayibacter sp. AY2B9]